MITQAKSTQRPRFSLCVCCYGDYPELSLRCVRSLIFEPGIHDVAEIHVGCNTVSHRVLSPLREWHSAGLITTLVESQRNLNKSGMQRVLFSLVNAPYCLWLDDDSHFIPHWLPKFLDLLTTNQPFDLAGRIHLVNRYIPMRDIPMPAHDLVVKKPWWRGTLPDGDNLAFPTGGCYCVRMEFVRAHGFPDWAMIMDHEDRILGDLITQMNGTRIAFSYDLMRHLRISDGPRRGEHGKGERAVDPRTGAPLAEVVRGSGGES